MKSKMVKALALSLATVMLCGMNVFAATSPTTNNVPAQPTAQEKERVEAVNRMSGVVVNKTLVVDGVAVEVPDFSIDIAPAEVATEAQSQAKTMVSGNASVLKVFDVPAPTGIDTSKGVQITFAVPNIVAGQKVAVLHKKADGTWESLKVNSVNTDSITATFTSFSPVAIVAYEGSPKTGEVATMTTVMAVICLAGVVVCTRKIRYSK